MKDRLNTLHDLLEEKLQVVKKFDEEILQLCEVKEIENEIEVSEELNSRVLHVKKQISKFFAKKIDDTGKVPIHDISIPDSNTSQVEITEDNVNSTQDPTPSNPTLIHPDPSNPAPSSQSSGNYVIGGHCAHECENGRLCRWCNGKHHQSICTKATKTLRKINPEETTKPEAKEEKKETQNLTTTTTSNGSSKVFLQTATTYAYSQHSNRAIPVRMLLDSGSQSQSHATSEETTWHSTSKERNA
ncbi:Hypothetical predicted protein [Paramuricea clavata]|uniref:Uncharacterized protein n=1 Tax=Paramuricea clavata TaxID=317549 RepID=A0A6S7IUS0_PARCT|nr:Hypothetical predicted protein [Paramuricea clavata]